MTRNTIFMLALMLAGAPALADCGDCEGNAKAACSDAKDLAQVRAKLAKTSARLAEAAKKEQALPAEQRKQLADARKFMLTQTADGRAILPTLVTSARLLHAAAAQEEKAAGKPTEIAAALNEMANAYAAIAGAIDAEAGKQAAVATGVREARDVLEKNAALWLKVATEKAEKGCCADKEACKAAQKMIAEHCPMHAVLADTMKTMAAGFAILKTKRQVPGGDVTVSMRDEFTGEAAKLHAKLAKSGGECGGDDCGGCDSTEKPAPAKEKPAAKPGST
jgi:hypothetical protein